MGPIKPCTETTRKTDATTHKMRNNLAEDVLDERMLDLMLVSDKENLVK